MPESGRGILPDSHERKPRGCRAHRPAHLVRCPAPAGARASRIAHRASRIAHRASRVTPAPRRRGAHASDRRETPARSDRAGRRAA
ncbi:hypothetical protein PMC2000_28610 [Burkholderia pseudomallei]|nr:hypothetical protein PMC2000_28610 [Burkholderia pseudomallei]